MDVITKKLDVFPLVKHYMDEMGVYSIFDKYIPNENGADIDPAQVLCTMTTNILLAAKPLYKIDEWLADYLDGHTETPELAAKYNDDRCARILDLTYVSDRKSMEMELSAAAIRVHDIETSHMHNDSTTISFSGAYENQSEEAVKLEHGFNKDHRPDYKQIVFGLNITEDGHVPISYELYDGSTADAVTHQPNWDKLREFIGNTDFVYIADCKLYSSETLNHISGKGGSFITLVPRNIKEIKQFINNVKAGKEIPWEQGYSTPNNRKTKKENIFLTYDNEKSSDGYRIIWVHSSDKDEQDKKRREKLIVKAEVKIGELSEKLNKYYLKTREQIEVVTNAIVKEAKDLIVIEIVEEEIIERKQVQRGRSCANTKYKKLKRSAYSLKWSRNEELIEQEERADGMFPLVTNIENEGKEAVDVLQTYKKQPFLEKRFYTTKSILDVAPVFLKKNERIEAMVFLYFIALMIVSLVERNIRRQMEENNIESLPILPSKLSTKNPTWNNIKYIFRNVHLAMIVNTGRIIQSIVKGVTALHQNLLRLLKVPLSKYENLKDYFWEFSP